MGDWWARRLKSVQVHSPFLAFVLFVRYVVVCIAFVLISLCYMRYVAKSCVRYVMLRVLCFDFLVSLRASSLSFVFFVSLTLSGLCDWSKLRFCCMTWLKQDAMGNKTLEEVQRAADLQRAVRPRNCLFRCFSLEGIVPCGGQGHSNHRPKCPPLENCMTNV